MSDKLLRTFIALPVPDSVENVQKKLKSTISEDSGKINWVHPTNLHLTLQFLGATPPDAVSEINESLEMIAGQHSVFAADISGTGCFPKPKRPRVLWIGVNGETKPLVDLGNAVRTLMTELGFPPDEKDFSPHITIGRIKYPRKITPNVDAFLSENYKPIPWNSKYFHLMHSELFPNGPVYTILGTHILQN